MFGLSFLSPLFLAGALVAAVPLVVHLFLRQAEPVHVFAAMRFLRRAPVEQARRRRLRDLWLLALRVLALLLLAFAFARPYHAGSAMAAAPATVVLVDVSASLSAPGQFARARALAEDAIRTAPAGEAVGVVAFDHQASIVAPIGGDRTAALAAVRRLAAGSGGTAYAPALALAIRHLEGRPGRLAVITDLQQSGWRDDTVTPVPPDVQVVALDAGIPAANVAVSALATHAGEVVARLSGFGDWARGSVVRFAVDGRPLGERQAEAATDGTAMARIRLPAGTTGTVSAAVSDRLGYAADDVRFAVIGGGGPRVTLVTASGHPSESLYLDRALHAGGGVTVEVLDGSRLAASIDDGTPEGHVIVLLATRGLERAAAGLQRFVAAGGGLFIAAGPAVVPAVLGDTLTGRAAPATEASPSPLHFAPDDERHPVFRVLVDRAGLSDATFTRTARIDAAGAAVLASFSDGTPALVERRHGRGRVFVFGSDLNRGWNDFPLQPPFVPFVHEAMRHLAGPRAPVEYLVGDVLPVDARAPGPAVIGTRRVVVNVDPRESAPARTTAQAFVARAVGAGADADRRPPDVTAATLEGQQSLWRVALAAVLLLLLAEAVLARRVA